MKKLKILGVVSLGHMVGHWYVGIIMLVLPLFKKDFTLSFTQVGLIISIRSLAGALGNTTSGILTDFIGKRNLIMTISAAGVGLCWFFLGFVHFYILILILLPLATTFSSLWHAPAMSVLSEAYPERKGFSLGVHGAAANMGQSASPLVVGLLITWIGWRDALKLNIIPGILMAFLLMIFLPRLGLFDIKRKTESAFFSMVMGKIFRNSSLMMISIVSAFRTMGQRGIETFFALFLADKFGLDPVGIGIYLAILTLSSTFPEPFIGWLSDHIGRRKILWISLTLSGLSVIAITIVPTGIPLMLSVGLLGFFHYSLRPIIFAFALDVTPPEISATTISYVFAWNQTFSVLSPLLGGFLADAFGVTYAMYFIASLTLVAAFLGYNLKPIKIECPA